MLSIEIRDIVSVFTKIFARNPDAYFFLKMDCEGAEYELLPALASKGLLSKFDEAVIEWHHQGSQALETLWQGQGFKVIATQIPESTIGLLRASRTI